MRKLLALSYILAVVGFACIARAQLPLTGAGKGSSSGGGGPTFPCAGTAIHLPDPNNLTTANWAPSGAGPNFGLTDPSFGATASSLVSSNTTFAGVLNATAFTLTGGQTYAFGAYYKQSVAPNWIVTYVGDGVTFAFGNWFDVSNGNTGATTIAGAGSVLACATTQLDGNGYYQTSFSGSVLATNTGMKLTIQLTSANNVTASTVGQQILAWGISP